jgi:hypothetical protein
MAWLYAGAVFLGVFVSAYVAGYALLRWFQPPDDGGTRKTLSILPIFALQLPIENAVTWIWIWLAAVFGLGLLWTLWSYVGPWFVRRVSRERPRWDDASPRVRVTGGPTRLDLVKGIRPGQHPPGRGER